MNEKKKVMIVCLLVMRVSVSVIKNPGNFAPFIWQPGWEPGLVEDGYMYMYG